MPPTYRERLRLEGYWLAAWGAAGSAFLLAAIEDSRRGPLNTIGQLLVAGAIIVLLARRGVRKSVAKAEPRERDKVGDGRPTALWKHPLVVVGLAGIFPALGELSNASIAWDASLRITGGCVLVGLTQAILMNGWVAATERETERTYFRAKGSRGAKTVLAALPRQSAGKGPKTVRGSIWLRALAG